MNAEQVQEELAGFVQALLEDNALHAWLLDLKKLPAGRRRLELTGMAEKMRLGGEHRALIRATELLGQPRVFDGVANAVEELRGGATR